jgi:L-fucose isomerase-like protein
MGFHDTKLRLGFLPANRGPFSDEMAFQMRNAVVAAMQRAGIEVVVPSPQQTKVGCVETRKEAQICAELFCRQGVQGIVVGAVNFGDEQCVAHVVREAGRDVPVMIFGCQEEEVLTKQTPRRDSFCGLLSIGEVLRQIGVRYSVASRPICFPADPSFAADLDWFMRVCRVVNGLKRARYGQVGTRPDAFWTCRFDEKQLQRLGATTVVIDLSEAIAGASAIADSDPDLAQVLQAMRDYADTSLMPPASMIRSAKLELFLRRWRAENELDALAIQCWTSIQHHYGVCSCTAMARLGDDGFPAACESDVLGAMSMHACRLASGRPAALADWNNLHNEDEELVNLWHCGVFPASFAAGPAQLGIHEIMVACGGAPAEQAYGVVNLEAAPSPLTLCRITQDADGEWKAVVAEGNVEKNRAETFGGYAWCRVGNLQRLYHDVLLNHFPHHVAITQAHVGNALWEALGNYLGMQMFHATQETPGLYTSRLPFSTQAAPTTNT